MYYEVIKPMLDIHKALEFLLIDDGPHTLIGIGIKNLSPPQGHPSIVRIMEPQALLYPIWF